jgi:hypothetical protein
VKAHDGELPNSLLPGRDNWLRFDGDIWVVDNAIQIQVHTASVQDSLCRQADQLRDTLHLDFHGEADVPSLCKPVLKKHFEEEFPSLARPPTKRLMAKGRRQRR